MRTLLLSTLLLLVPASTRSQAPASAQAPPSELQKEITAFNLKLEDATRRMSNADALALWAEDGVSLLPSTSPLVGKPAITAFFTSVTTQLAGARMDKFELHCTPAVGNATWASEWCDEHQVVWLPGGKPVFDGRGRMLLILHKEAKGDWKITREMWQPA